ncbi:hypothetical protein BHM03_00039243, partial [Ensete ventricosum]
SRRVPCSLRCDSSCYLKFSGGFVYCAWIVQLEPADPDFYKIGYVRSMRAYGVEFMEGPNGFGVYASKDVEPLRRARVIMEIPLELMLTISQKLPWMFFPDIIPVGHPIFDIINSTKPEIGTSDWPVFFYIHLMWRVTFGSSMVTFYQVQKNVQACFWHIRSVLVQKYPCTVGDSLSRGLVVVKENMDEEEEFSLPSGKVSYRPIHTGPTADRYTDQSLSGGTTKIDRRRSIEEEKGKRRKKKRKRRKKYLVIVLACALPAHARRPWVDREPLPPSLLVGRPRDVASLAVGALVQDANMLVPYADMLNHSFQPNCFLHWRFKDRMLEVMINAGQRIKKGEEVSLAFVTFSNYL